MSETAELQRKERAAKVHEAAMVLRSYSAVPRDFVDRLDHMADMIYEDTL